MYLTKEEFCLFSQSAKLQLVKEFGTLLYQHNVSKQLIRVFRVYDFYLEVVSDHVSNTVLSVNIVSGKMLRFYAKP
jgi:hypothetical protein